MKAHYDSIHGRIESNWSRTKNKFEITVVIPANTSATVYVPAADAGQVRESGKPLAKAKGVKFLRLEAGQVVLAVESGEYHFTVK